jgi:hypothetical protein
VVHVLAGGLFGRHVQRRAGDHARLRQAGVVGRAGQAEVGDLDSLHAVFQQDVRRLDVAVDQPLLVRRRQPAGFRVQVRPAGSGAQPPDGRVLQEAAGLHMGAQQRLDAAAQGRIAAAGGIEVGGAFRRIVLFQRGQKDLLFVHACVPWDRRTSLLPPMRISG